MRHNDQYRDEPQPDHRADPVEDAIGVLECRACGRPVRTANGGRFPVHADPRPVPEPRQRIGG